MPAASFTPGHVEGHAGTAGESHRPLGKCRHWWKTQVPRDEPGAGEEGFRVMVVQMHELEGRWCAKSDILVLRCKIVTKPREQNYKKTQNSRLIINISWKPSQMLGEVDSFK